MSACAYSFGDLHSFQVKACISFTFYMRFFMTYPVSITPLSIVIQTYIVIQWWQYHSSKSIIAAKLFRVSNCQTVPYLFISQSFQCSVLLVQIFLYLPVPCFIQLTFTHHILHCPGSVPFLTSLIEISVLCIPEKNLLSTYLHILQP